MTDTDKQIEALQTQITELESRKVAIKAIKEDPDAALGGMGFKPLGNVTDEEKVAAFDRWHERCAEHVLKEIREQFPDEDFKHYLYEDVMQRTLGERVFDVKRQYGPR